MAYYEKRFINKGCHEKKKIIYGLLLILKN